MLQIINAHILQFVMRWQRN